MNLVAIHHKLEWLLKMQLMILVDNVGRAFPSLNHSPWFGVTLADFVMPFFLFVVGVSIGLVFKVRNLPNLVLAFFFYFRNISFIIIDPSSLEIGIYSQ